MSASSSPAPGRIVLVASLPAVALLLLYLHGPLPQDVVLPNYHDFADRRPHGPIPNYWNVISNLPFLLVALYGLRARASSAAFIERWERRAYEILLAAVGLTAIGSAYYHAWPSDVTLFWDRLPMALVFSSLLATAIGERVNPRAGRLLLLPLLALGAASVLYWRAQDDLRLYLFVQFSAVLGLPLLLFLFPPRYTGAAGVVAMIALYCLALLFDRFDTALAALLPTGGHPWKHLAAALAIFCYVHSIGGRRLKQSRA